MNFRQMHSRRGFQRFFALLASSCALTACQQQSPVSADIPARDSGVSTVAKPAEPANRQLLWGDTHLHTRNSADAFETVNANADLETAYRFAEGLPVRHPRTGAMIRIDRPLDFLVVADHAEMMGIFPRIVEGDAEVLATKGGRELAEMYSKTPTTAFRSTQKLDPHGPPNELISSLTTPAIVQTSWDRQIDAAERHNRPGKFTALIGWEWSSTPNGINLHRVVFTPAHGNVARRFLPLSNYDTMRPEDLWKFLRDTRARTGADFVAIPHNSNFSQGQMWEQSDPDGNPITAAYAAERMEWERVVEVTQYKGTSETHPALSTTDEFAGYEIRESMFGNGPAVPQPGSYVRYGLLEGLAAQARLGINPFAFGLIGSSDSHSGLSSHEEREFFGKSGADLLLEERASNLLASNNAWKVSAGGLAAVWADRNDRQAVFDAFRRREVYGTSGPRIALRVFGGVNFTTADRDARDLAAIGYRKGVPMGGELLRSSRTPALLIQAVKDPTGANLDRVQVIKGWLDDKGVLRQKIFNVAWSGARRLAADGSLPAVGNTVDLARARYSNSIGATELTTVWRDPEFSADQAAFYYVRVLEIPTPRHQLFDALALGIDPATTGEPLTLQERAWSSPIWYRP